MFNGLFVEVKQQTENLYSKYNGFYIEKYIYKYPNTILFLENFKKNVKLTSSVMTFLKPLMKLFLKTCLSSFRRQEITNGTNILSSSTSHNLIILVKVGEVCLWKLSEFYFHSITSWFHAIFLLKSKLHMYIHLVFSQFSSNTENLIEVEEVFGVGDFVFSLVSFCGDSLYSPDQGNFKGYWQQNC